MTGGQWSCLHGLSCSVTGGVEPVQQDQWSESEVGADKEVARLALSPGIVPGWVLSVPETSLLLTIAAVTVSVTNRETEETGVALP